MQKLNISYLLQLTNMRMQMTMMMKQMMSMTFRYRMGEVGSAHFMIMMLKLHPKSMTGIVKLFEYPTNPDSPAITINIFHPIVSQVQLPRHHNSKMPKTREVMSWQTKGAVNSLQNQKCFRCQGSRIRDQRANVGIFRKGGYGTTKVMQTIMLTAIRNVVKDFSLQYGANKFWIIQKKVSLQWLYSPSNSCGDVVSTVNAFIFDIYYLLFIN